MSEAWQLPLLFGTGLVAGFVDSIAGGGGLISLPVLLNLGFDPALALGTNKLQGAFGSGSASWHYARAGTVDVRDCVRGFIISFLAAGVGSAVVVRLHPDFLRRLIPILLVVVAVYVLLKPQLGAKDVHPRMTRPRFDVLFGLALGFYDGFFGPGAGTFWTMAFMLGLGFNMTKATGYTKIMNFASNLASLAFFLVNGRVVFAAGLAMGAGQWLGAQAGSRLVVRRGTGFIRPVFIAVVLVMTGRLLWQAYGK